MPSLETIACIQKAVLWPLVKYNSKGEPIVGPAQEIHVRYEKGTREALEAEDGTVSVNAVVMVDREISIGSILRLGTLADLPASPNYLVEVVDFEDIPDVKGRNHQYTAKVRRFKRSLPTIQE